MLGAFLEEPGRNVLSLEPQVDAPGLSAVGAQGDDEVVLAPAGLEGQPAAYFASYARNSTTWTAMLAVFLSMTTRMYRAWVGANLWS